ncbi:hypothetical protein GGI24_005307 [Coemansia furcata]|nr:hypothetical protein GGI24_005307 [Coemansia furcata]
MPRITREIASMPGHCKMLAFYFIDPTAHIPSTEVVPPQQRDWWMEDVLSHEPFRSLPLLVIDDIMNRISYPMPLKDAKQIRVEIEAEVKKKTVQVSTKFFQPACSIKMFKEYR